MVVGLGNPGREYRDTRHNVGYMAADLWAASNGMTTRRFGLRSRWGSKKVRGQQIVVLKPKTYMNLSGIAVKRAIKKFKLDAQDIIIVHDDLDIPLGRIKISLKGGAGGHKGIKSIIDSLGTKDFIRVRVGIGRPPGSADAADWVLSPFEKEEIPMRDQAVELSRAVIDSILTEGVDAAMNQFHQGR